VGRDDARRRHRRRVRLAGAAALGTVLVASCSAARGTSAPGPGTTCGTARTAADVPVIIKVATGSVACSTALEIENEYAARIRAGQVPGTGGGAPIRVGGWTCQGFNTPQVLSTGDASRCRHGETSILAVLPASSPSATTA
jgi:hypothetical protein